MAINFRGYLYDDSGTAIQGATVQLLEQDGDQEASTTTDSNGLWYFNEADQDTYDIKITRGSSIRYIQWDDQISLKEIDVRNDSAATTPALTATNLTNSTANQVAVFSGANSTRADGDEIYLSFKLANSAGDIEEFARMTADAVDVTDGSEDGQIRFGVSVGGTMTDVFTINSTTAGSTDMTLDVSGDLTLDADGGDILFKDGGTTFGSATNTSGNLIIKSGTTTALTFSGANVTAAGTIGSGAITSTGIVTGTGFTAGSAVLAEAELELLDGLTAGTAIASKVVTTDANIDTTGQRNLTITGELDAATLDISGNSDFDGTLDVAGNTVISAGTFTVGSDGSGQDVYFYSATSGDHMFWDASDEKLVITGTDGQNSLEVADGNVTITDNLTVSGNFTVSGTTTTIDTTNLTVTDPLIKLAQGTTASPANDLGIIFTRGNGSSSNIANRAILWDESADQFAFAFTNDEAGTTTGNVDVDDYADVRLGALVVEDTLTIGGTNIVTGSLITTLGTITAGVWQGTAIASGYIAADAITGAKIADDAIDSEHYTDGSIDLAHMSSESVDEDNLYISNSGSNGQFLSKQSGNNGGLTWATPSSTATAADDIADGDGAVNILTTSGNITIDAQANDTDVIIKVDDNGSSVTAVTFDGSDEGNAIFVNDVQLKSDGALLEFGADLDTTLTHTDGTGLTLNSTNKLAFGDTGTFIHQSSDGVLTIESDTTVDINGAVVLNGAVTGATNITLSGELDAATLDLSGAADIAGDLVLSGGADGALQFTNAGENSIKIPDNQASALIVEEADNAYITFTTTNSSEAITIAKATTFSAGAVLSGDSSIQLDSTPGDEDVSGITAVFTAGEALERGEVVYFKAGDSKMWKGVATATGTMPVVAMAAADISADATGVFLLHGFLEDNGTFPSYTVGGKLYAPEAETSSQNVPEQTAPDSDGDFVQVLGFAVTANLVYFNPSNDIIEHA